MTQEQIREMNEREADFERRFEDVKKALLAEREARKKLFEEYMKVLEENVELTNKLARIRKIVEEAL